MLTSRKVEIKGKYCDDSELLKPWACRSRARNRVAQQRYRSRQRERLAEKEEKLAELNEQLAALTTEKVCATILFCV